MKTVTSKDAQRQFGAVMDQARREPIIITKHGRETIVMLPKEDFDEIRAIMEDRRWGKQAQKAQKTGYLSVEESEAFLN